jgi:hypothetical protein
MRNQLCTVRFSLESETLDRLGVPSGQLEFRLTNHLAFSIFFFPVFLHVSVIDFFWSFQFHDVKDDTRY